MSDDAARDHRHGRELLAELAPLGRELRSLIPGVYAGFGQLHDAAFADAAVSRKHKELIALAIAISVRCDGCIASHARGAAMSGASEQEVAETIGVTISMNGGPGTVYGPRALAAFRSYSTPSGSTGTEQ
jgi:AhpD family alkylhydroperoxidase